MLSHYPGDKSRKTNEETIISQRRIIAILTTLLIAMAFITLGKFTIDFVKQKQAGDIIASAQEEANQILFEAKSNASEIEQTATEDANKEAATIIETAKGKADTIINNAINTKIDDIQTLLAITEAEAGGQSVKGRAAVAATIKNRVKSDEFEANSIKKVVYSPGQFDPVSNGTIRNITPTPSTVEGVKLCLEGKDYSNGALYFYNPSASTKSNRIWFSTLQTTAIIGDHVFKK